MHLSAEILQFFQKQSFVIIATIDKSGRPHTACKGIIKMNKNGYVYLLDLYMTNTYANLKNNPNLSITAVDEYDFKGYCLKGRARIVAVNKLKDEVHKAWEEKISSRITQRLIKNLRDGQSHNRHPEALLPGPRYLIMLKVDKIVDLVPAQMKKGG